MASKKETINFGKRESAIHSAISKRESTNGAQKPIETQQDPTVFEFTPEPTPPKQAHAHSRTPQGKDGIDEKPGPSPKQVLDVIQKRLREEETKLTVFRDRSFEAGGDPAVATLETRDQKVARMQGQVASLLTLLERSGAKDGSKEAADLLGCKPSEVSEELKTIEQRLLALANEVPAASRKGERTAEPGLTAVAGSLMHQLDTFATTSVVGAPVTETAPATDSAGERITYDLRYSPNVSAVAESSKVAALEAAVVELEKQLGAPEPGGSGVDLHATVSELYKRVALLDVAKIDSISQRVKTVMEDVQRYEGDKGSDAKEDMEGAAMASRRTDRDTNDKVNELYEYCHRWDAASVALPQIVARLRSLQALHQQSASFTTRLQALEQQQEELLKLLETTNTAVRGLGEGLQENMTIFKENMASLEAKVDKALKGDQAQIDKVTKAFS